MVVNNMPDEMKEIYIDLFIELMIVMPDNVHVRHYTNINFGVPFSDDAIEKMNKYTSNAIFCFEKIIYDITKGLNPFERTKILEGKK